MQEFVECVRHGRAPSVDGQDGLLATLLADAARLSCAQNRPVRVDESGVALDAA